MSLIEKDNVTQDIIQGKLQPNELLAAAVESQSVDLIRIAMEYGACISSLCDANDRDEYFESLRDDIASCLCDYSNAGEQDSSFLCTVLSELSLACFDIRNHESLNRNFQFEHIGKIPHWSIGLITREVEDEPFLSYLNHICDLDSWSERYSNLNAEQKDGFYLISALTHEQPFDIDPYYISASITGRYHLFLVDALDLRSFIGDLTLRGAHKILGIVHTQSHECFSLDGHVNIGIFDKMKSVISSIHQNNQG